MTIAAILRTATFIDSPETRSGEALYWHDLTGRYIALPTVGAAADELLQQHAWRPVRPEQAKPARFDALSALRRLWPDLHRAHPALIAHRLDARTCETLINLQPEEDRGAMGRWLMARCTELEKHDVATATADYMSRTSVRAIHPWATGREQRNQFLLSPNLSSAFLLTGTEATGYTLSTFVTGDSAPRQRDADSISSLLTPNSDWSHADWEHYGALLTAKPAREAEFWTHPALTNFLGNRNPLAVRHQLITPQLPESLAEDLRNRGAAALLGERHAALQSRFLNDIPAAWLDLMASDLQLKLNTPDAYRTLTDCWMALRASYADCVAHILPALREAHAEAFSSLSDDDLLTVWRSCYQPINDYIRQTQAPKKPLSLVRSAQAYASLSPASMREVLSAHYGSASIDALMGAGKLHLLADHQDLPLDVRLSSAVDTGNIAGATLADGSVYLIGNRITPDTLAGLFLHEVGEHAGLADMLGPDYGRLTKHFQKLLREKDTYATWAAMRVPASTKPEHVASEQLAYLVERVANEDTIRAGGERGYALGQECLSNLRTWLFRTPLCRWMDEIGALDNFTLTPQDMAALAREAVDFFVEQTQPGTVTENRNNWVNSLNPITLDTLYRASPQERIALLEAEGSVQAMGYLYALGLTKAPLIGTAIDHFASTLAVLASDSSKPELQAVAGELLVMQQSMDTQAQLRGQMDRLGFAMWMDGTSNPEQARLHVLTPSVDQPGQWQLNHYSKGTGAYSSDYFDSIDRALVQVGATSFIVADTEAPAVLQDWTQTEARDDQTDSHSFKRWFDSSQATDTSGNPLVLYVDKQRGETWASTLPPEEGSINAMQVYVQAKHPFDADRLERTLTLKSFFEQALVQANAGGYTLDEEQAVLLMNHIRGCSRREESGPYYAASDILRDTRSMFGKDGAESVTALLKLLGFDSIKMTDHEQMVFGVLEPAQMKPATGIRVTHALGQAEPVAEESVEALKRWAGQSKVVDANGLPLVVFHGTGADITRFDLAMSGTGADHNKASTDAHWFSSSTKVSDSFARLMETPSVIPAFIKLENPLVVDCEQWARRFNTLSEGFKFGEGRIVYDIRWFKHEAIAEARAAGHDGVIFTNGYDGAPVEGAINYAVFEASQIKSAIGNRGTYDPNSDDIRLRSNNTNSEAFNAWFKQSKIIGADGKPLVVYHGTRPGRNIGSFDVPRNGRDGIYFTPDPQYAEAFTVNISDSSSDAAGSIYPVYLSIQNPFVVEAEDGSPEFEEFVYRGLDISALAAQGYDGAVLNVKGIGVDQIIAFRPEQIKSAIGNIGTFDPSNADIRLRSGGDSQTDTPAFQSWFRQSQVVDDSGNPLVLYRGIAGEWDDDKASVLNMAWASESSLGASEYVKNQDGANVVPVFMAIQHPADLQNDPNAQKVLESLGLNPDDLYEITESKEAKSALQKAGYDGIRAYHYEANEVHFAAFRPEQIKSAIGNIGTFDPNNADIRLKSGDTTETPAFKSWFADSKVVDADGKPVIVRHGTYAEFYEFRPSETGTLGKGIYFAESDSDSADQYGERAIDAYLSLQNPWVIDIDYESDAVYEEDVDNPAVEAVLALEGGREILDRMKANSGEHFDDQLTNALIARGHDGIIATYPDGSREYVAFSPEQIKSATENIGTFDPSNADIRLRSGGDRQTETPAFKSWFDGSRAVDGNGNPLVVYRGLGTPYENGADPEIAWVTPDAEYAALYAQNNASTTVEDRRFHKTGANVLPLYVSVKNPFDLGFRSTLEQVSYSVLLDRINAGVQSAFERGVIGQESAAGLMNEISTLQEQDSGELKKVHEWWSMRANEVKSLLERAGYDAIKSREGFDDRTPAFGVFRPEQIKSAIGNIGTFDPNNADIRFSFAGIGAVTANMETLRKAHELAQSGASPAFIQKETGWHRGVDARWRFEISDDTAMFLQGNKIDVVELAKEIEPHVVFESDGQLIKAKYKPDTEDYIGGFGRTTQDALVNLARHISRQAPQGFNVEKVKDGEIFTLDQVLDHPDLFAAYPFLSGTVVQFSRGGEPHERGSFHEGSNRIELNADRSPTEILSTLLHETQHVIQAREDFARGGNSDVAFSESIKNLLQSMSEKEARQVELWKLRNESLLSDAEHTSTLARNALKFDAVLRLMAYGSRDKPSSVFRLIRQEMQWIYDEDFRGNEAASELQGRFYAVPRSGDKRNAFIRDMAYDAAQIIRASIPAEHIEQFIADERSTKGMVKALRRQADAAREKLNPLREQESRAKSTEHLFKQSRHKSAYEVYRSLAGEIEARATQARQHLTPEERRYRPAILDMDVSPADAIVVVGGLELLPPFARDSAPDITDSLAFQSWFNDSKVVDADGKPLVVYHGTNADIDTFELAAGHAEGVSVAFFTSSPEVASDYALNTAGTRNQVMATREFFRLSQDASVDIFSDEYHSASLAMEDANASPSEQGGNLLPVYLSMQNPKVIDLKGGGAANSHVQKRDIKDAWDAGHDGLIYRNGRDGAQDARDVVMDSYIVFRPEQIKSAIGNVGTFDRSNTDIRFSVSAETQARSYVQPYNLETWMHSTGLPESVIQAYGKLGDDQRGEPEQAMVNAQVVMTGNPLSPVIEHVGDLTNRMSPKHHIAFAFEETREKAENQLRKLRSKYGFARDVQESLERTANYRGIPLEELTSNVDAALERYAAAHERLEVHTEAQRLARDAAVALGRKDFEGAAQCLEELLEQIPTLDAFVAAQLPGTGLVISSSVKTNTPAFKNWFDDSKVVDDEGKPLVVYHGTGADFSAFDVTTAGQNFNDSTLGFYFTNAAKADIEKGFGYGSNASEYAENAGGSAVVMPVYLSIQNPLVLDDAGEWGGAVAAIDLRRADIARWVKAGGHDGVIAYDATGDDLERVYVAFRPEQIKSAIGNIGTFDPNNADIRFSFAGPSALTADQGLLTQAQSRIAAGDDAELVRRETGWFQGHDKGWRFEIDDSKASLPEPSYQDGDANGEPVYRAMGYLGDHVAQLHPAAAAQLGKTEVFVKGVLDHPQLFAAYPQLSTINVVIERSEGFGFAENGEFRRSTVDGQSDSILIRYNPSRGGSALSALLHEVQHAIQKVEGFARGGSTSEFDAEELVSEELRTINHQITQLLGAHPETASVYRTYNQLRIRANSEGWPESLMGSVAALEAELLELPGGSELFDLETERFGIQFIDKVAAPFEKYRRLAGEVEARNVQTRLDFDALQRQQKSPFDTEDIAPDQINVRLNTGSALAMALQQERAELEAATEAKLDMSREARLARAQAMGFDTSKVWYHGTNKAGFKAFNTNGEGKTAGTGAFLADYRLMANSYTKRDQDAPIFTGLELFNDSDLLDDLEIERYWVTETPRGRIEFEADQRLYDTAEQFIEGEDIELDPGDVVRAAYTIYHEGRLVLEYATEDEAIAKLDQIEASQPGIYELYARTGEQLVIDWQGRNWDDGPEEPVWHLCNEHNDILDHYHSKQDAAEALARHPQPGCHIVEDTVAQYYSTDDAARQARDMGYDSVLIQNVYDSGSNSQGDIEADVLVVFDAANLRSTAAAFDPRYSARSNLLFSVAEAPQSAVFDHWFDGSQVCNPDGSPLVVYLGDSRARPADSVFLSGLGSLGFSDFEVAQQQAQSAGDSPRITPAYLAIKRPLVVTSSHSTIALGELVAAIGQPRTNRLLSALGMTHDAEVQAIELDRIMANHTCVSVLKAAGYDGAVYARIGGQGSIEYRVFDPAQVASGSPMPASAPAPTSYTRMALTQPAPEGRTFTGSPATAEQFTLEQRGVGIPGQHGYGIYLQNAKAVTQTTGVSTGVNRYANTALTPASIARLRANEAIPAAVRRFIGTHSRELTSGQDVQSLLQAHIKTLQARLDGISRGPRSAELERQVKTDLGTLINHMARFDHVAGIASLPSPADYLSWDTPLQAQSEEVRDALALMGIDGYWEVQSGQGVQAFTNQIEAQAYLERMTSEGHAPSLVSQFAPDHFGIPTGGQIYQELVELLGSAKVVSTRLEQAGIRGIRYQPAPSTLGDASDRFVVFPKPLKVAPARALPSFFTNSSVDQPAYPLPITKLPAVTLHGTLDALSQNLQQAQKMVATGLERSIQDYEQRQQWLQDLPNADSHLFQLNRAALVKARNELRQIKRWQRPTLRNCIPWSSPLGSEACKRLAPLIRITPTEKITGEAVFHLLAERMGNNKKACSALTDIGLVGAYTDKGVALWDTGSHCLSQKVADASDRTRFHLVAHGSKHFIDEFDTSKIGTGEGVQAFGYGLYFADRKMVASHYQKMRAREGCWYESTFYDHPTDMLQYVEAKLASDDSVTPEMLDAAKHCLSLATWAGQRVEQVISTHPANMTPFLNEVVGGYSKVGQDQLSDFFIFPSNGIRGLNAIQNNDDRDYSFGLSYLGSGLHHYLREGMTDEQLRDVLSEQIERQCDVAQAQRYRDEVAGDLERHPNDDYLQSRLRDCDYYLRMAQCAQKVVRDYGPLTLHPPIGTGNLYLVDLTNSQTEYLRYDLPFSQQSALVQKAVQAIVAGETLPDDRQQRLISAIKDDQMGHDLLGALAGRTDYFNAACSEDEKYASELLHAHGVQGIKYPDGLSRDGGGESFNYVIFDADRAQILGHTDRYLRSESDEIPLYEWADVDMLDVDLFDNRSSQRSSMGW